MSLPLRILYTINSSPQYILARSSQSFPVDFIQNQAYASTPLKHCLHTICMSSPELIQDTSRDFSVYVLDPLESNSAPAPVQLSNSSQNAQMGVAVGFGLMSWALRSEDNSVKAVGTVVESASTQYLEVVFALREVCDISESRQNANFTLRDRPFQSQCLLGDLLRPILTSKSHSLSMRNLEL